MADGNQLTDAIKAELGKISDQLKEHGEKALAEANRGIQMAQGTKEQVDDLLNKQTDVSNRLSSAEQILAKIEAGTATRAEFKAAGQQFVDSEQFKAFAGQVSPRGRVDMTFNAAITTLTTDADGSAGDLASPYRVPGVNMIPNRELHLRDLITPGRTDSGVVEYVQETGFTNNAATVAEGAKKPESSIKFDLKNTNAKVIAHYVKASRQILSDAPQLASLIEGRLLYGLKYVEDAQILKGDGTGQNLLGIVPQATAYANSGVTVTSEQQLDKVRLAMLQVQLAEYAASGVVLNPIDWAVIETLKDTTGRYIVGNPQGTADKRLWGLPVVTSKAMDADKFLVGAFKLGAQLFDRWLARVEVATENEDDFVKNMVTILAEERLALAVYRPQSFVFGDFARIP